MNKVTVAAIIIILAAFGGLIAWASLNSDDKTDYTKFDARSIIEASEENGNIGDHVRGKADSKVISLRNKARLRSWLILVPTQVLR